MPTHSEMELEWLVLIVNAAITRDKRQPVMRERGEERALERKREKRKEREKDFEQSAEVIPPPPLPEAGIQPACVRACSCLLRQFAIAQSVKASETSKFSAHHKEARA